jgi:AAHS family 4-hydroxybenzoate transporter-like MFS transporter
MIPAFGWRSVLLAGGVVPLGLTVLLWTVLPESVRYMVVHSWPVERIRRVLARIAPAGRAGAGLRAAGAGAHVRRGAERHQHRALAVLPLGSFMMWLAYFMGLVIFYALINWMPVLFKEAGLDPKTATLISALFPLGGVGAVLFGWLMDRFNANRIIAAGYALTAVAIWAIGHAAAAWAGWWPPCSSPAR